MTELKYPMSGTVRFCLALVLLVATRLYAQQPLPPATTHPDERLNGFEQRKVLTEESLVAGVEPVSIGPTIFSCRVTDVDVDPSDPTRFYVAYASGGLWFTESNGTRFRPVFDQEASMTIGDIAVDWKRNTIWVGTGEANSSRSSYAGTGVYKSTDGGKRWTWMGLPESHHIGRIVIHPENPDVVWVAVLGHLYSPNPERGVYRSQDGGKTWERTLFVHENAGAIDLCLDPQHPDILYAASWERERRAWNFKGAGAGSGIWKSADGGRSWTQISTAGSGFPTGEHTGRIGLSAGLKDGRTVLYACLDNQQPKPKEAPEEEDEGITRDQLRTISKADFLKLKEADLAAYLKANNFPEKYSARKVFDLVRRDQVKPQALVEYLEDANSNLFETDYTGAEVYRSDDGGQHWYRTHKDPLERINFTYGYYFSTIYCHPANADKVYLLGFLIITSDDGGKTWKSINGENVHVDHHALWINPQRDGHLINGNDGGLNLSWDDGASWIKANNPPVGQFYTVAVDEAEPYSVYGGAQDNGVWTGPSRYSYSDEWHQTGAYPYKMLLGGDGMQVAVDTRDNSTVYTGFQFGNYFRMSKNGGRSKSITPKHELGERPLRFNWQTPIHLSRHNQDILYIGAHKLFRSFDQGERWEAISGDLTRGGTPAGNVPYGTLTCIHESPLRFGLLYTGSDDGLIHVTRDGGDTWTRIGEGLPDRMWVSSLQASAHEKGRVFVALNGYRWDNFNAMLYRSEDYGQSWTPIGADLPAEPVNVVREDPVHPDLLYVGTDHGLYLSLDGGRSFQRLAASLPAAPVHDLVVQKKAAELIVGTHGRSLYRIPVGNLQQMDSTVLAAPVHLFPLAQQRHSARWGRQAAWSDPFEPKLPVEWYTAGAGAVQWKVSTTEGLVLQTGELPCVRGLNHFDYTLDFQEKALKAYEKHLQEGARDRKASVRLRKADTGKYYLHKGSYIFELTKDGRSVSQSFTID